MSSPEIKQEIKEELLEKTMLGNSSDTQLAELEAITRPLRLRHNYLSNRLLYWKEKCDSTRPKYGTYQRREADNTPNRNAARKIMLVDEQVRATSQKLHDLITPYAQASCLSLCEGMQVLPREIRDMIYAMVHARDTIYVGPEYLTKNDQPCESDRGAHYWDAAYMGSHGKLEICQSWYRTCTFYFYDKTHNNSVIEQFFKMDRWDLGIHSQSWITSVRMDLGPVDNKLHNSDTCCRVLGLSSTLTAPLKFMHLLPNYARFFIRLHTYRGIEFGCIAQPELADILTVLLRDLETLYEAGHRFVVQWSELDDLEFSYGTCGFSVDEWMAKIASVRDIKPERNVLY